MNTFLARVRLLLASPQRVFAVEVRVDEALREVQVGRDSVLPIWWLNFLSCLYLFERLVDTQYLKRWLLFIATQSHLILAIAVSLCWRFNGAFTEVFYTNFVILLLHFIVHLSHIRVNLAVILPDFK